MNDAMTKAFNGYLENYTAPPDTLQVYDSMLEGIGTYCHRLEELAFAEGFRAGLTLGKGGAA